MLTVTMTSAVALRASVPAGLRSAMAGPRCAGTVLARFPTAIYVAVPRAFGVIALLGRDAVRLPCGLHLPGRLPELPGNVVLGEGVVRVGHAEVQAGRVVSLRLARRPAPEPGLVRAAARAVGRVEIDEQLLGRGPGLTPSGDDVLAGYLAGAAAYGLDAAELRALVHSEASRRTTTLSAALLRHAAAGEAIPQVSGLLDALGGVRPLDIALAELLAVGHTSGPALAAGVVAAARMAA